MDDDYTKRHTRIAAELQILETEQAARLASVSYKVHRFFIRCGRIFLGMVFGVIAAMILSNAPNVSDTPFAALTFGMLFGNLIAWAIGASLVYFAFTTAFGEGPKKTSQYDLRETATANIDRCFPRPVAGD
ncbi:MAG: hypothetical protein H0X13_19810 [Ramlibacter sp.]|nr:hypothetical protein [Ramlibacter sp.]